MTEASKAYYRAHREELKAYAKAYYQKHKEELKAYARARDRQRKSLARKQLEEALAEIKSRHSKSVQSVTEIR